MAYPKKAIIDPIRSAAFGSIGATYTAVGDSIESPIRIISITNLTDHPIYFSDDGVNDKFILPAGAGKVFDITTNRTNQENLFLSQGFYCYLKHAGVAPTSGSAYIEIIRS